MHQSALTAVAALSRTDAWAVGVYEDRALNRLTLIEHWNGVKWTRVPSPDPGPPVGANTAQNGLVGVAAVSRSSAWAVGGYTTPLGCCEVNRTLILHWNGRTWKKVSSPNAGGPGFHNNLLTGVSALSGSAWAVGGFWNGSAPRTLALHWNGRDWARVASPNPSVAPYADQLLGVVDVSRSSAIAVGYWTPFNAAERTFMLRWNGRNWKQLTSPNPGGTQYNQELAAVAGTSCANVWAVGDYSNNNPFVQRSVTARC